MLPHNLILALHQAAIDLGLARGRDALLQGVDERTRAALPDAGTPGAQLLRDLETLNGIRRGDPPPLRRWLENAAALTAVRSESRVFHDALSALLSSPHPPPSTYFGRRYLFEAVEWLLEGERSGYLSIHGEPGMGKSAFLAEYARRTRCVIHAGGLAPAAGRQLRFLSDVRAQLLERFGVAGYAAPGARPADVLADLLKKCARKLGTGEPLVIAVDGVELAYAAPDMATLDLPADLPDGVYVLLARGRRPSSLATSAPQHMVRMNEHAEENEDDARAFLQAEVERAPVRAWAEARDLSVEELVSELARRSGGNFMYLQRVLHAIGEGRYTGRDPASLPRDLPRYYEERWDALASLPQLPHEDRDAIAYVLAEAKTPLSPAEIVELSAAPAPSVDAVLGELADLLSTARVGGRVVYGIVHDSFREFLYWQDCVQARGAELAGDHPTMHATLSTLLGAWQSSA